MPHSTSHIRQAEPSPTQLTLLEGIAGWRDTSPRSEAIRDRALRRRRALQDELDALRDEIEAEKAILATLRQAQDMVISETIAYAKQKRMAFDEIVEALHDLMGTDHPRNIAKRLGYSSLDNLVIRLQRNGYHALADQLRKPLRKPPAPYPSRMWRAQKSVD